MPDTTTETHRYLVSAHLSGVIVHETPPAGNMRLRYLVVVADGGTLWVLAKADTGYLTEDRPGPCPYRVVEHDCTEWVTWPGSIHQSLLYLDVHGPDGYHAQLLWDTVGYPWVCVQSGRVRSAALS